jgi:hypothetical protein
MKLAQVVVVAVLVTTPLAALAQWGRALPAGAPGVPAAGAPGVPAAGAPGYGLPGTPATRVGAPGVPAAGAPGYGAAGRGFNAGGPINHLGPR